MKFHRKKLPYKLLERISSSVNPFTAINDNTYSPVEGVPIIFAVNHSNMHDFPTSFHAVGQHAYVLLAEQTFGIIEKVFFFFAGMVMTDRMDRNDTAKAKAKLTKLLQEGKTILWFPEGTWNLTANLLMLPMKWGIVDAAKSTGAQIIPVAMEYDYTSMICTVRFGQPMFGTALDKKDEAIRDLRDAMATLRWDLISRAPAIKNDEIDREKLKEEAQKVLDEYRPEDWERELSTIFEPYEQVETVPSDMLPRRENAFLFSKAWNG